MTGCGSAWLERLLWEQEVASSNLVTPIICASGSEVEHHLAKVGAAGSNPVSRSTYKTVKTFLLSLPVFFYAEHLTITSHLTRTSESAVRT